MLPEREREKERKRERENSIPSSPGTQFPIFLFCLQLDAPDSTTQHYIKHPNFYVGMGGQNKK